jgi:hypothetical protein
LDAFEDKFFSGGCSMPQDGGFPLKGCLLVEVIEVGGMFGPAVDESKRQVSSDLELGFDNLIQARHKPVFVVTVFRTEGASSEMLRLG